MTLLFVGLGLILAGGVAAVAFRRSVPAGDVAFVLLVLSGSGVGLVPALRVLSGGPTVHVAFSGPIPGGAWVVGIDPLSAAFLLVVLGVGAIVAVYGVGYLADERGHRAVAAAHLGVAGLLVALALVVTARSAMLFLIAWELMSLIGLLLIVFEHERRPVRRAGLVYVAATHVGTLVLFILFAVWGRHAGGLTFDALAAGAERLPAAGALVLLLALVGFGVKAGLVPLHFWLPDAHAAAPSHVSALLSGIVIKMGIYGLLRVQSLAGTPPAWWGWTILTLGVASGIFGVIWALAQHDLKRLLAYHSVENIGIILMGMGLGALGLAYDRPAVAAIGYAGALLHTLNHALFKSLLFCGAGSVLRATGTREIDRLGGLARALPFTWVAFLIGAAAIVGLPPLNGFVSEWVVYQGLFQSALTEGPLRLAVFGAAGLALIGALALACFAKVAGVVFLGQPRREAPRGVTESGPWMTVPMAALAAACILIGVRPLIVLEPALRTATFLGDITGPLSGVGFAPLRDAAHWIGLMAVTVILVVALIYALQSWRRRHHAVDWAETWGCGYARPDSRMQYTGSSFAAPLLEACAPIAGVQTHRSAFALRTQAVDLVLDGVVLPSWRRLRVVAERLRPIQSGRLHSYLIYIVATVLALLVYLFAAGRP